VRGRDEAAKMDREHLLTGYEEFREFDSTTLALIEPLRAIRMIHYAAWISRRWQDPSFSRLFPEFGTERYWFSEIEALQEILELIG
jgi:Ser/Thr protein kinase RdoA (MazF antagonist)